MRTEGQTDTTKPIGVLSYRRTCLKRNEESLDRNNTERNRNKERRIKNRQCTYNVTTRRVSATIVAVENQ